MFKLIRVLPFCAPPLLFSRRHPSSNYQSIHCHDSINSVKHLRIFKWLFQQRLWLLTYKSIVRELVSHFNKNITLILHKCAKRLMKSYSKSCIGSFRSSTFLLCNLHKNFKFTKVNVGEQWGSRYTFHAGSRTYPTRNIRCLRTCQSYSCSLAGG